MNIDRLKTYSNIFWYYRRLHFMLMFEYRADFIFWSFISIMWTFFNFFFYLIIANANNGIAGWSVAQIYVLLAVYTMLDALTWSIFYPNMRRYTELIFTGELSGFLLKPIDTQFLLMTNRNGFSELFRLLIGVVMLVHGLQLTHAVITPLSAVIFLILFTTAALFVYHLWFFLATLAFWVERLQNINDVVPNLRAFWDVPRSVYTGVLSTLFTIIVPFGLVTSLPSEVLLGKGDVGIKLYFIAFTVLFMAFTRWFFHASLRRYQGTGG